MTESLSISHVNNFPNEREQETNRALYTKTRAGCVQRSIEASRQPLVAVRVTFDNERHQKPEKRVSVVRDVPTQPLFQTMEEGFAQFAWNVFSVNGDDFTSEEKTLFKEFKSEFLALLRGEKRSHQDIFAKFTNDAVDLYIHQKIAPSRGLEILSGIFAYQGFVSVKEETGDCLIPLDLQRKVVETIFFEGGVQAYQDWIHLLNGENFAKIVHDELERVLADQSDNLTFQDEEIFSSIATHRDFVKLKNNGEFLIPLEQQKKILEQDIDKESKALATEGLKRILGQDFNSNSLINILTAFAQNPIYTADLINEGVLDREIIQWVIDFMNNEQKTLFIKEFTDRFENNGNLKEEKTLEIMIYIFQRVMTVEFGKSFVASDNEALVHQLARWSYLVGQAIYPFEGCSENWYAVDMINAFWNELPSSDAKKACVQGLMKMFIYQSTHEGELDTKCLHYEVDRLEKGYAQYKLKMPEVLDRAVRGLKSAFEPVFSRAQLVPPPRVKSF